MISFCIIRVSPQLESCASHAPRFLIAAERRGGIGIGFLPRHAPIFELIERDLDPGHGAADERSRRHHLEIAVKIAEPCLAAATEAVDPVHLHPLAWAGPYRAKA